MRGNAPASKAIGPCVLHDLKDNTELPEHRSLAAQYQVQSIPNMKLFKQGQLIKEFIGLRPKDVLKADLEAALSN